MTRLIKPERLHKGDTIATISPSWGCAGSSRVRWEYELGCERLMALGLNVVAAPNSMKGTTALRNSPEARAEDINWAFDNKDVKAIIANIGGNDSERLFPYLSPETIKDNPKIFCGYSDVMALHIFCYRQGLMTFYGDNLLTNIAENPDWHSYSRHWFEKAFFDASPIGRIEPSKDWSYGGCKHTDKNYTRNYIVNQGYCRIQGKGSVTGNLFGGHLGLADMELRPEDFDGCIFFFEDIPECCRPDDMAAFFDMLGQKGYLQRMNGIVLGKMRLPGSFEPYSIKLREVISGKYGLNELPVMGDMNFGHTSPIFILPYGAEARLDVDKLRFDITENGVV